MKIKLEDYTEAEVRAMEAGPLLDWLAWQGLGAKVHGDPKESPYFAVKGALWFRRDKLPGNMEGRDESISQYPGAAMRALEQLAQMRTPRSNATLNPRIGIYTQGTAWLDGPVSVVSLLAMDVEGSTPMLAIARACALWGLRKDKP